MGHAVSFPIVNSSVDTPHPYIEGSLKFQVSFAKEPYKRDNILRNIGCGRSI